jgi:hypothetical protein
LGPVLAEQRRIPLHPPEGKRKRAIDLPNVDRRQEF